jgi:hypothetical protein
MFLQMEWEALRSKKAASRGKRQYPDLEEYIASHYEEEQQETLCAPLCSVPTKEKKRPAKAAVKRTGALKCIPEECLDFEEKHESRLEERMQHMSDTFSQYLLYLLQDKQLDQVEVYKRALVDKKTFSKIRNHSDYHPQKLTALCLCVGAKLNLDETRDLLARAGYALSPCDKTDIIFSYFIENEIYDMIELDIQLEEHGLPCVIS